MIFNDFHRNLKVDVSKFMFFKDRSGASRLMKTVIFEVVPRGPGDPLVKPRGPEPSESREVTRAEGSLGDKGG